MASRVYLIMKCSFNGKDVSLSFSGSVGDLLKKLEISDQIVLVKKNGDIVTELEQVTDSDTIDIQQVVFGG